jgi:hypothetical protein
MRYLPYFLANLLFDFTCVILNPIVAFFVDEEGNVPDCMKWFTTFDQKLVFSEEWIAEKWPLLYKLPKDSWIRLYLCRATWLYRNMGYTFALDVCGYEADPANLVKFGNENACDAKRGDQPAVSGWFFCYDKSKSIWTRGWCLYTAIQYRDSGHCFRSYFGWKLQGLTQKERKMLAMNINPLMRFQKASD